MLCCCVKARTFPRALHSVSPCYTYGCIKSCFSVCVVYVCVLNELELPVLILLNNLGVTDCF